MYPRLAKRIDEFVPVKGLHVLDFGCGPGYLSQQLLARDAATIVGVDINKDAIDQYNASAYNQGVPEMRAVHVDALPNQQFDLAVMCLVLHHMDANTIAQTFRKLKSSSKKLVIVENEHLYTATQLRNLLLQHGFSEIATKTADRISMHGSTSHLVLASAS